MTGTPRAKTLDVEQRQLLFHMGGWQIREALLHADTDRLMASCWGGSSVANDGGSPWLTSFQVGQGVIRCPAFTDVSGIPPRVEIRAAALRAYGKALPQRDRDELAAVSDLARAERDRTNHWCHCGRKPTTVHQCAAAFLPPSYHPTKAQDAEHYAELRRIRGLERQALARALQLPVPDDEPTEDVPRQRKVHKSRPWTTSEMTTITNNLHLSNIDLGRKLDRTADAVKHKRRALSTITTW